jgi:hypothetical protein
MRLCTSDVLGGIDSHFHVHVEEPKAEEGTEGNRIRLWAGGVVQVGSSPGRRQQGERSLANQRIPAMYQSAQQEGGAGFDG